MLLRFSLSECNLYVSYRMFIAQSRSEPPLVVPTPYCNTGTDYLLTNVAWNVIANKQTTECQNERLVCNALIRICGVPKTRAQARSF